MSSAPETISIKRRRDDDIVDVLALTSNKKQRTSGHYFVRLPREKSLIPLANAASSTAGTYRPPAGVPTIGTTKPGDEIQDFVKYKAAQNLRNGVQQDQAKPNIVEGIGNLPEPPQNARRFHLTRDLSFVDRPQQAGARKPTSFMRPHLPTFVEKLQDVTPYAEPPIDRIISSVDGANHELDVQRILSDESGIKREQTATFQQSRRPNARTGQSIRDDPATWDLDSDRLADELMTLALEMDPEAMAAYRAESASEAVTSRNSQADVMSIDGPDDYVYETYVRVQEKGIHSLGNFTHSNNVGYLIIDEDQEDLWDQYLRDDDDSDDDWDEEDADSNAEDNPRNDYPEDEISSDDEYGRNIYKHRQDYSDDDQDY